MSTLNDMILEMRNHGFEDTDAATLTDLLNDAYEDIWGREAWPFREGTATVTITGGTAQVPMPADFGKVIAFIIDNQSIVLEPKRLEEITRDYSGDLTTTGSPLYYYFIGNNVYVFPVPDSTYTGTVRYIKAFTPLANPTDTPVLPSNHRIIVLGALVSAYDMEDDNDIAARFQARFEARYQTVREEWWMRQYDRPEMHADLYMFDDIWE